MACITENGFTENKCSTTDPPISRHMQTHMPKTESKGTVTKDYIS